MKNATAAMTAISPTDCLSAAVPATLTSSVSGMSRQSFAHSLTTEELAAELGIGPQSIRKRYSQTGSYFGLRPVKLPNRRLLWPSNPLEKLINR
jgi:hypothetical protein